jgi:putative transcriptional regulator
MDWPEEIRLRLFLEPAADMHKLGMFSDAEYNKITMRHLGKELVQNVGPVSADEIRAIRERAHMSQAVFARQLGVTAGYVSKFERGVTHPTRPALVLLNVIRRKGIEAIL